jgi:hypothetical protein
VAKTGDIATDSQIKKFKTLIKMKKIILLYLILFATFSVAFAQPKITAEKVGDKIEFRADGNLITSYIISDYEKYPFFFPVNGPSKANVTSMRNALYPHHSSLFFGCDKVNGGNYWQEGLERGQIVSLRADILESGADKAVILETARSRCTHKRQTRNYCFSAIS